MVRNMNEKDIDRESVDSFSLRGRVFNRLREDILDGIYKQHDELRENTIALELGVSRTPVREALRQLELEGLVNIIPNKGAYVTGITKKDIQDIYVIRSYLEGLCAKWACENMTKETLDELEEIVYLSDFHMKKEHHEQVLELDNRFHELLYQSSGSKILRHVLSDFHHYVKRTRFTSLSRKERAEHSNNEHLAIVEAIRSGNEEEAQRLAHEHIISTIKSMPKTE